MSKVRIFLLTYAWLIFTVFIVILLLSVSNVLKPEYSCELSKDINCKEVSLKNTTLSLELWNELEEPISASALTFQGKGISCSTSAFTVQSQASNKVTLNCELKDHQFYKGDLILQYNDKQITGKLSVKP